MKKSKKIKIKKSDIKKSWQFKLLVILILLLIVLIFIYIWSYKPQIEKEEDYGLPTLGFGEEATTINLNVTDYSVFNYNQTINITIKWISGEDILKVINITFNRSEGACNYIIIPSSLNEAEDEENFTIESFDTNCEPSNFTNIINVKNITAVAGVNVSINPIKDFDNPILYKGENLTDINLSEYFECNVNELIFNASSDAENISVNQEGTNVSFYPDYGWFGRGKVLINATCRFEQKLDEFDIIVSPNLTQVGIIPNVTIYKNENLTDVFDLDDYFICDDMGNRSYDLILLGSIPPLNKGVYLYKNSSNVVGAYANGSDSWIERSIVEVDCYLDHIQGNFWYNYTNYTRPPANIAPHFNRTVCDDLVWEVNTNYKLNMKDCWYDEDNGPDSLSYRYANSSSHNNNLSIKQNSTNLTLVPDNNWVGTGYFYVYCDDGEDEEDGRVDFIVRNTSTSNTTLTTNPTNLPEIKSSSPSSSSVSIFNGTNKTFSITAENYENVKWYLNGGLVKEGELSFDFNNLEDGDIIKVEIINGTRIDSKTWNIKIEDDENIEEPLVNVGKVVFYLIVVVIVIIIFLVVWLFIVEKNKKKGKMVNVGFGFVENNKKKSDLNYFNIPH